MKPESTVTEPARTLPVTGAYELVVAGGGIAGVAAAVAAARCGASVCLLEKMCAPGGLATLGNVIVWLPLCDGRGRQVAGGLAGIREGVPHPDFLNLVSADPAQFDLWFIVALLILAPVSIVAKLTGVIVGITDLRWRRRRLARALRVGVSVLVFIRGDT